MSLNLCADQWVLALLPLERITSVTWLARDAEESFLAVRARQVPANYGSAEEVLRDHPDLIITGEYTMPATRSALQRMGYPLLELKNADDFEDIRARAREVGEAVGARAQAEHMIAEMDAILDGLSHRPKSSHPRVVFWDGSGAAPGRGTLYDAIISAAGAHNIAAENTGFASLDVEGLLARAPEVLLQGDVALSKPSRRNDIAQSPLIRERWGGRRVAINPSLYLCGTPFSARAARDLRADLDRFTATSHRHPGP